MASWAVSRSDYPRDFCRMYGVIRMRSRGSFSLELARSRTDGADRYFQYSIPRPSKYACTPHLSQNSNKLFWINKEEWDQNPSRLRPGRL